VQQQQQQHLTAEIPQRTMITIRLFLLCFIGGGGRQSSLTEKVNESFVNPFSSKKFHKTKRQTTTLRLHNELQRWN